MAEFQEVIRQWRRMCDRCSCSGNRNSNKILPICPIVTQHCGYPCDECLQDWSEESTKKFEEIVMAWAAKHPEPVYPTWAEYLRSIGVIPEGYTILQLFLENRISPDIAEKLGLKPKEGA